MSMKDCMAAKAKAGKIDKDKAAEASAVFDEEMSARGGDEAAAAKATLERLQVEAAIRKRQSLLQVQAQQRLLDGIRNAPDVAEAAIASIDATGVHGLPFVSAEATRKAQLGLAHAKVTELIAPQVQPGRTDQRPGGHARHGA